MEDLTHLPKSFDEPVFVTKPYLPPLPNFIRQLEELWKSHKLTNMGLLHNTLEQQLCQHLDATNFKLFNNGTLALQLALQALEIKGEVLVTPFTFPATVHAITQVGATPVFCDIDPDTLCIDPNSISRMSNSKTSAIIGVHVYGIPCDVDKISTLAQTKNLKVIYDAAHAFGTTINKRSIASFGDITMFSFHATKLFHTIEGGGLSFQNRTIGKKLDLLRNFGIEDEDSVPLVGTNAKMNEVQAAMGIEVLKVLDQERAGRTNIRNIYHQKLSDIPGVTLLLPKENISDSLQYAAIRINQKEFGLSRDQLHFALKKWNIFSRKYFYPLCSDFPPYASCQKDNLVVSTTAAQEVLCLPFYGTMGTDVAEKIGTIIKYLHTNN
jgi:dTDP-4-amino-4,6-dideoxygalactose transaminase